MILDAISIQNPFADPQLHWAETKFSVGDVQGLTQDVSGFGRVEVTTPRDLQTAVAKRRSEFLAGRFCATLALRQSGKSETIGRNGRAPVWPKDVAGSITHSRDRAIAAVSTHHRFVGLDCEALVPQDRAMQLSAAIFSETESRLRPDALPFATFFTLVFSAKEALYKALSPRLDRVPDFLDVTLTQISPTGIDLTFDNEPHRARFLLSGKDCVTLVLA